MAHESIAANPFMLMLQPEVVLAAIEKSERLSGLNRHLCRPLDRPVIPANGGAVRVETVDDETEEELTADA